MSKPWKPPRRTWARDAYVVTGGRRGGPVVTPVLIGAAVVGLCIGGGVVWLEAPRGAAPGAEVQPKPEILIPEVGEDPADAEWAARGEGDASPTTRPRPTGGSDGVHARFSYCKWGGGTNCVVDGDTFFINGEKVRIAGIDAPETHDYRCSSELALGEQAASQLQALLNSGAVTMTSIARDRDSYGRLLRNVSVDGRDVGETMISVGLAREYAGGRRSWC